LQQASFGTATYLRFSFPELEAYFSLCKGRKQWAIDSASIILLEIYRTEYGITAAVVVGRQAEPKFRKRLIEAMNELTAKTSFWNVGWSHNWQTTLGR
jgi:hypothetical protein